GDGTVTFQQNGPAATLSPNLVGSPTISPAPGAPSTTSPAFGWPGATRFWQQTGSNTPTFVLERMGPAVGLSVSDFGAWANIDGSTGVITNGGFFAGGIASGTTVPATGSATYNGTYIADLKVHAESTAISGGIRLNANFAQSTISSTFTSGALADHPTATGSVTGQFYGANAAGHRRHQRFRGYRRLQRLLWRKTLALPLIGLRVPGALEAVARAEHRQRRLVIVGAHLPEIAVGGDGQREVAQILPADELDQLALGVA